MVYAPGLPRILPLEAALLGQLVAMVHGWSHRGLRHPLLLSGSCRLLIKRRLGVVSSLMASAANGEDRSWLAEPALLANRSADP
jgi:hypothetical protein